MITKLKQLLYFPLAWYFRFFAQIRLRRWNPKVIVVTGSSGKTTLMHLIAAQLSENKSYRFTPHANSAYGIPFDILGIHRQSLRKTEWVMIFIKPLLSFFSPLPTETTYIVEADCDRPYEGEFLAVLLRPQVTLWLSSGRTHSMNFDHLARNKQFETVERAIAHEFSFFSRYTKEAILFDADNVNITTELDKLSTKKVPISQKDISSYTVMKNGVNCRYKNRDYSLPCLQPEVVTKAIGMTIELLSLLNEPVDSNFTNFTLPPGRCSVLSGKNDVTIIDSCYNANLSSMTAILQMYKKYPAAKKWLVLGDMLEQGEDEDKEHEKLGEVAASLDAAQYILMGVLVKKNAAPLLISSNKNVVMFDTPKEVLDYLTQNLPAGTTILFKGGRLLEGVIEHLLQNPSDAAKLARREEIWMQRRKNAGL